METGINRYMQTYPQYRTALEYMQSMLNVQSKLIEKTEGTIHINKNEAQAKWQAGQPLFSGQTITLPALLLQEALTALMPVLQAQKPLPEPLLGPMPNCRLSISKSFSQDLTICAQKISRAASVGEDTADLLLQTVLAAYLEKQAQPYRAWVQQAGWRKGTCPVCGFEPWLARLARDNGQRSLVCSLCRTEWIFDRLRCPFCQANGSNGRPQLRHFTTDNDEAHRADCCGRCHRYIKTVDERASVLPVYLPAEDVITTHLDTLAREQGYR